ncbi:S8 family peptidase [Promicromonospora soli]|uniref:Peptidase S8 n=1 Tax=Promicromonospora soli TaxID=2035533 RepID=A0A919KUB6_9MICO|nr:S8 family serine peptidase [Promicromonospora soli]GHH72041.1 peptidase S8 [Promicromonospora soli]
MSEPMPEGMRVRDHAGGWRPVRELDPASDRLPGGGRAAPTRYVRDRVIIRGDVEGGHNALLDMITARARENGVSVTVGEFDQAPSREAADVLGARPDVEVRLDAVRDDWDALGLMVSVVQDAGESRKRVSLDHVVTGHKNHAGFGDPHKRVPAVFPGTPPVRTANGTSPLVTSDGVDRPVVAILDTGIGQHPWFDEPGTVVLRGAELDGQPIGTYPEEDVDAEREGRRDGATSPLDPYAGHGTFIAGVVHQTCPDAALLPVRVYGGDGTASEWDFARSVERLLEFHLRGLAGVPGYFPVDVMVIASGYYLEHPEDDDDYEGVYRGRLRDLRRAGVLVVASAGNDGSTRRTFPAGWAPPVRRTSNGVVPADAHDLSPEYTPLLGVAASNPDGTLADFSNDGAWISAVRPGVQVLSTMPTTFDGAAEGERSADGLRHAIDPDDFTHGYGTWSGTSFSAPHLAGELAAVIFAGRAAGQLPAANALGRVSDAWHAVTQVGDLYSEVPGVPV